MKNTNIYRIVVLVLVLSLFLFTLGCGEKKGNFELQKSGYISQKLEPKEFEQIGFTNDTLAFGQNLFRMLYKCDEEYSIKTHSLYPKKVMDNDIILEKLKKGKLSVGFIRSEDELLPDDNFNYTLIGCDSLLVLTSAKNPVQAVTSEQIKQILLGEITNWNQLGGQDGRIVLSEDGFKDISDMTKSYFGVETKGNMTHADSAKLFMNGMQPMGTVGENETDYILAFTPYYAMVYSCSVDDSWYRELKQLSVDGVKASEEDIKNKTVKVVYSYAVTRKGNENQTAGEILDIIKKAGSDDGNFEAACMSSGMGIRPDNYSWQALDTPFN